ncbi:hemerythrin domain-containing protein [Vampirovibrio sp.]|uniref:hemerythrin domain-containing protein n=1 Tax=Vampirovibrio sp. TaxID=2717857 RepID=UPI0035944665
MNFLTLLKEDHKAVKDQFQRLLKQNPVDKDEAAVLYEKLLLHMAMEERYFYPAIQKIQEAEGITLQANLDHEGAKTQIQALQQKKNLDEISYKVKLDILQMEIMHHIDQEESEVFPVAKSHLSEEELQAMGVAMMALKEAETQK